MDFYGSPYYFANTKSEQIKERINAFKSGKNLKIGKYTTKVLDWFFVVLFFGLFFGFVSSCMAIHAGTIRDDSLGVFYKFCGSISLIVLFILLVFFIILVVGYVFLKKEFKSSQLKYRETFNECLDPFKTCWNQKINGESKHDESKKPSLVGIFYSTKGGKLSSDPSVVEIEMDEKVQTIVGKDIVEEKVEKNNELPKENEDSNKPLQNMGELI
jgi:hypothetical protein